MRLARTRPMPVFEGRLVVFHGGQVVFAALTLYAREVHH